VLDSNTNSEVLAGNLTIASSAASLTALAATDTALNNAQQNPDAGKGTARCPARVAAKR
jgi:hypothetical protein